MVNIIEKLEDKPEDNTIKKIQLISGISSLLFYILMGYLAISAGSPAERMFEGQTAFSGTVLKEIYSVTDDLDLYRIVQTLDYLFMVLYHIVNKR